MYLKDCLVGSDVLRFFKGNNVKKGEGIVSMEKEETVIRENFPLHALYMPCYMPTEMKIETIHGRLSFRPLLSRSIEWILNYQSKYDYGIPLYAIIKDTIYVYTIDNVTNLGETVHIFDNALKEVDFDIIIKTIISHHFSWMVCNNLYDHIKDQIQEVLRIENKKN